MDEAIKEKASMRVVLKRIVSCFIMTKHDWLEIVWYSFFGLVVVSLWGVTMEDIGWFRWLLGWFISVVIFPKRPWVK